MTLNYDRLAVYRPEYGYKNRRTIKLLDLENDGIFRLSIEDNSVSIILSLDRICKTKEDNTMKTKDHWVIHLELSPDGKKVIFLHRWRKEGTVYTRLMNYCIESDELDVITGNKMVSHCCWLGVNKILAFCHVRNVGNRYVVFDLSEDNYKPSIVQQMPHYDGHPSLSPNYEWLLFDTYPDKSRMSRMYLKRCDTNEVSELGAFYQPSRFVKKNRIDLHPKWSPDGAKIAFESGHSGKRKLYIGYL